MAGTTAPLGETTPSGGLLSGVRVLDFGWVWAGALPGQVLAFLGAEVIKVETRTRLDYMRLGPPIVGDEPDPEQQPMFHNINRGKLSLTVDFQTEAGRQLILDLVEYCDVVIENYAPGVLERAGLDYDRLRERRPDVVMLSLSGGGQEGPLRDMRSYASTIAAYSGLDSLCGYPGEQPLGVQQSYPDPNASLHGAAGLLAALLRRKRTGEGDHLDLAQMSAGLVAVGEAMACLDLFSEEPGILGNTPPNQEPIHDAFKCAGEDDWVAVEAADGEELRRLAGLVGIEDAEPVAGEVHAALERWCAGRSHFQAMEELQAAGIAAGAVTTAKDRFESAHYRERGIYLETEHPVIGWEVVYGEPWVWPKDVGVQIQRAPLMGEANEYVVCELLGRSREEYERLEAEKVLY